MKAHVYILGLLLFFTSCKPTPATTTTDVQMEKLAACETGRGKCQPIEVVRQSKDAKTIVRFQISSSRTSMQLFDATYPKQMEIANDDPINPIIDNYREEGGNPTFELTALPDGKYYVRIIGDAVGGIFELNLKTKN